MEFKDRLKQQRQNKNISQQKLADAIFVSRSAVAKWENGLGIPNETSYQSLLVFFGLTKDEFPLHEEIEQVSVTKNRTIRTLSEAVVLLSTVILCGIIIALVYAFINGYGFTAQMSAGDVWADAEYIETPEYVFYYDTLGIENETDIKIIDHFCAVEKKIIGYQKAKIHEQKRVVYDTDRKIFGYLYSFPQKTGYCHFFISSKIAYRDTGVQIHMLNHVIIEDTSIPVLHNSFFETDSQVGRFEAYGKEYYVE